MAINQIQSASIASPTNEDSNNLKQNYSNDDDNDDDDENVRNNEITMLEGN